MISPTNVLIGKLYQDFTYFNNFSFYVTNYKICKFIFKFSDCKLKKNYQNNLKLL